MDATDGPLKNAASDAFVGREREMASLRAALADASQGKGRLFLLAGEPGIGKTRLAAEIASVAETLGFSVVWGRCWEAGGAPAYWPWVQCIRALVRERDAATLISDLGADAALIGKLMPEISEHLPALSALPSLETEGARFRLFDAISRLLRRAAEQRPLMIVFDDLQAADTPSLLLLRFAAPELLASSALILALYRSSELGHDHPMQQSAGELLRIERGARLTLGGLSVTEVAAYVQGASGVDAAPTVIDALHAKTEGNPLFLGELVRLHAQHPARALNDARAIFDMPLGESVHEVIDRRLHGLTAECHEVLRLASILGREFNLAVLEKLAQRSRLELLGPLGEARAALVMSEVPASINRWRFEHVLIRDAIYEDIAPTERAELHRRAGQAQLDLYGSAPEHHFAELAHHFSQAASAGEAGRALEYAKRAGDRATSLLAFEEAARLYETALEALDLAAPANEEDRCRLLLALGDVQTRAGDLTHARTAFLRAAELARTLSRPDLLGAAALGYGGRFVWLKAGHDPVLVPLLREAVSANRDGDAGMHARLLARLAGALRDEPPRELAAGLAHEAVQLARPLGDPATLAYTLVGQYAAAWWPGNPADRLAIASELVEVARASGDLERLADGLDQMLCAHLELGQIRAVDRCLADMAAIVDELKQPAQRWVLVHTRAMRALLAGRLAEADELIEAALSIGQNVRRWGAVMTYTIQLYVLRREQGRLEEMEPVIRQTISEYPRDVAFPCLLAQLYADLDRAADAQPALEAVASHDFADLPRKSEWLFGISALADAVRFLRDRRRAALLYDLLRPFAARAATVSPEVCVGSVSRPLGILASLLGRWDDSVAHFEEALQLESRMGARPWMAHTQYEYARMLIERGAGHDPRVEELLSAALSACSALGLPALERKISVLRLGDNAPAEAAAASPRRGSTRAAAHRPRIFHKEGDYWALSFEGDTLRIQDSKGLRYLSALLRAPGHEFLALALVGHPVEAAARRDRAARVRDSSNVMSVAGNAGRLLDEQAKAEYRQRLIDLEAELAEAEEWADPERAARAHAEREMLVSELSRAIGLGGRLRSAASDVERARLSTTKSIKSAIARIRQYSPALAEHLTRTVHTGTFCSYNPDPSTSIPWQL